MQSKLLSVFVLVLLVFGNIPAWGMDCCKAAPAGPSCCCSNMASDSDDSEEEAPQWTRRPCRCHTAPAPAKESKPVLVWQASQPDLEYILGTESVTKLPGQDEMPPVVGLAKDSSPRAPPCPLYLLYGVCLN